MITKLTAEQEGQLAEYRAKWLRIGLATGSPTASWDVVRHHIDLAYAAGGLEPPTIFVHVASPMGCLVSLSMLSASRAQVRDQVWTQVRDQVWAQVEDQVWTQVRAQVEDQVRDQVGDQVGDQVRTQVWDQIGTQVRTQVRTQVGDQVRTQVRTQVWDQIGTQVRTQVRDQVWTQVRDQVWAQVEDQVWTQVRAQVWDQIRDQVGDQVRTQVRTQFHWFCFGSHDYWLSMYDYIQSVLGVQCSNMNPLFCLADQIGWWLPYRGLCVVSQRPDVIRRNAGGLHCDGGPAVQYADGWSVWALNGVRVAQEIAEMSWDRLDPHLVLTETNAEVRREIVRKIGIERVCAVLGAKTISTWEDYELLLLNLGDGRRRPYLKMCNPSIGVYHIEGVHPDCTTVAGALAWRNGDQDRYVVPDVLS